MKSLTFILLIPLLSCKEHSKPLVLQENKPSTWTFRDSVKIKKGWLIDSSEEKRLMEALQVNPSFFFDGHIFYMLVKDTVIIHDTVWRKRKTRITRTFLDSAKKPDIEVQLPAMNRETNHQ